MSKNEGGKCAYCNVEMMPTNKIPLRVGGTSGEWLYFFGHAAEAGEAVLDLDGLLCPKCGCVELFANDSAKRFLTLKPHQPYSKEEMQSACAPKSFLKNCVKCNGRIPLAAEECPFCGAAQKEGVKP
jgi:ribosomal protein L40E